MLRQVSLSAGVLAAAALLALTGCGPSEPKAAGGQPDMRRITDEQYHNIVADVFGGYITVGGHADPLLRTDGLLQVGAREARVTPSGADQYYAMAKSIAAQVTSPENRASLIPCQPKSVTGADEECTRTFFTRIGRLLYRRPLTAIETKTAVEAADNVASTTNDFYRGLAFGLEGMLVSPKFLFVIDETEPDPNHAGGQRLTGYAKAARLSFFLWNTTPDDVLLTAAEKGELATQSGIEHQAERMMASRHVDEGARAFFADFLNFDRFDTLEKDAVIYPAFSLSVATDAREQMLRTISEQLIAEDGDYRDLFTSRKTFVTENLGRIYKIPVDRPDGGWMPYEFPKGDPHVGILTEIGFVATASHPGRSSPTLRGRAIRELVLCQKVPDPPGDVDFSVFNDPNSPNKTARERLTAHRTAPACAGCHKITDPIGLGLENFDGVGQLRSTENGVTIDPTGDLDGVAYKDAASLAQAIHDNPATTSCLVNRFAAYAVGRPMGTNDKDFVKYLSENFAHSGYRFRELMQRIASSNAFYAVSEHGAAQANAESSTKESKS